MSPSSLKDITGVSFGCRTAIRYAGNKKWETVCTCGRLFVVDGADLRRRTYACRHVQDVRFWSKVTKVSDGCWHWTASTQTDGYGTFRIGGSTLLAHRISWEASFGLIPIGMELDHLCRNRSCVRPDHLEPVTHAENVRRGDLGRVTRARLAAARWR